MILWQKDPSRCLLLARCPAKVDDQRDASGLSDNELAAELEELVAELQGE